LQFEQMQAAARLVDALLLLGELRLKALDRQSFQVQLVQRRPRSQIVAGADSLAGLALHDGDIVEASLVVANDVRLRRLRLPQHFAQRANVFLVLADDAVEHFRRLVAAIVQPTPGLAQQSPAPRRTQDEGHKEQRHDHPHEHAQQEQFHDILPLS
jgi:hypothetical protein